MHWPAAARAGSGMQAQARAVPAALPLVSIVHLHQRLEHAAGVDVVPLPVESHRDEVLNVSRLQPPRLLAVPRRRRVVGQRLRQLHAPPLVRPLPRVHQRPR